MVLSRILDGIPHIDIQGSTDIDIENITYDSRQVTPNSLFFCIEGFNVDGHDFAADAVKSGARALVLERDVEVTGDVTKIFVEDSRLSMALISANFYGQPAKEMKVVGITGTNGKTSVAHLLKSVLESAGLRVGLVGTITNMIGNEKVEGETTTPTTPESLDLQRLLSQMKARGVDVAVMEVTSHSLSLKRVGGIMFDVGVFTNLSPEHLDFHKTIENYREAKGRLFENSSISIINIDDDDGRLIASGIDGEAITYGIRNRDCDIFAREIDITSKGISFDLCLPDERVGLELNIPGIFSVYNSLAVGAIAYALGIESEAIKLGLESVYSISGRFELLDTDTDYSIIIDYAHTPDGLENILETARGITSNRLITLFGCGGDRDREKRAIMGEIAGRHSDLCIVTSDNPRTEEPMSIIEEIIPGLEKSKCPYKVIENRKEAIEYALSNAKKGDVIILAGKGHETYQILKDKTIEFDERKVVSEFLERRRS